MKINNPKELFVMMLSDVRQGNERTTKLFEELGKLAEDPDVKEALEARVFISKDITQKIDQCFKLIGAKPVTLPGRLHEVFVEEFRKELAEIESPVAKKLFILTKVVHLIQMRVGEYLALIAAADVTGHYGVGVLLETCMAEKLAFIERTRRLIRKIAEVKMAALV
jgi:ferritin-like metal-binding protein YciE